MSLISPETKKAHRAMWYVYLDGERIRRVSTIRGLWSYDAVCSCGWDSRTGGGTRRSVKEKLWWHLFEQEGKQSALHEAS